MDGQRLLQAEVGRQRLRLHGELPGQVPLLVIEPGLAPGEGQPARRGQERGAQDYERKPVLPQPLAPPVTQAVRGGAVGTPHGDPVQVSQEVLGQRVRRGIAVLRVLLKALGDDGPEVPGQPGELLVPQILAARSGGTGGAGGGVAGEGELEGAAQGVHVRGRRDLVAFAAELFGGHVGRGAQDPAGIGEGRLVQGHGQPEIADIGGQMSFGVALQKDVGGLEVPVGSRDQLHGHPEGSLEVVHIVDPADVRVDHPGVDLGLVHEPDQGRRLDVLQDLQRHIAAQHHVPGLVDVAHAAPAQERAQHIAALARTLGVEPQGLQLQAFRGHSPHLCGFQTK